MMGLILLDKPPGISSAAAVSRVKYRLPRGVRIGHAGTLDPFASGLLLLLVGKATRLCEQFMSHEKQYLATFKFGATTATLDPKAPETPWPDLHPVTPEDLRAILPRFTGRIMQVPPAFSAMKVHGQRAYELARRGQPVQLEARPVHVERIQVLEFNWPLARLLIDCGRGTYIRSLARDIGEALNVGGYVTELRRTRLGPFTIEQAVTLQTLLDSNMESHLLPPPANV